jgi:hypothetical protein
VDCSAPEIEEQPSIGFPGRGHGLRGVVEEIDVARDAGRSHELVERCLARDVALAGGDALLR